MAMTSLYDGVDFGKDKGQNSSNLNPSKIAGWSDNLQFMKTQLQLKKATTSKGLKGNKSFTSNGPGNVTLSSLTTPSDKQVVLIDEYNPLRPNEYSDFKQRARERDERERREKRDREEREKDEERRERRRRSPHRDDRDRSRRKRDDDRRSENSGRAAIAPPPSLLETTPINPETIAKKENSAGTGGFSTGNVIASQIMAKYGWKEGQGLGREEQGLSTCLEVEKTGKRAGKIINKDIQKQKEKKDGFAVPLNPPAFAPPSEFGPPPSFAPPPEFAPPPSFAPPPEFMTSQNDDSPSVMQNESNITDLMKTPSKVVLLKNMVGPGEVDDELQPEIEEECSTKYGPISKVIIFEIPGAVEEEAVRIFIEFKKMESAIKALVNLNNRFFGGRTVSASFYNLDRFRRLDLAN